jgi:hypothetical protein
VVPSVDGKDIAVHLGESPGPRHFSIWQVKPALLSAPVYFSGSISEASERINSIHWTEIISRGDPRGTSPQMKEAIQKEVRGLISRGTFRLQILDETRGRNIVPSKFVLAIKYEDDGREVYKIRLCLGGHRDFLKNHMVHTATTLTQTSTRPILALAAIFGWNVWTTDVQQAYLQSASRLKKEVFLKTDALELGPSEFLELLLPLYGLAESGDYWGETLGDHHLKELRFRQSFVDFALFFKVVGRRLAGLSGAYVDDLLRAGPSDVRNMLERTLRDAFDCKESKVIVDSVGLGDRRGCNECKE